MAYLFLAMAIATEVTGTSLLKFTEGFTRLWPTLGCLAAYGLAFYGLTMAISRGLQVGTGYAVWAGMGTALIVVTGAVFLHEPITLVKVLGVLLVITGIVVLNLSGTH
jgi:small multidrug resistance pump